MNVEVIQESSSSVVVSSEKTSEGSSPQLNPTSGDVAPLKHVVNDSGLEEIKTELVEITSGTVHTDSGITIENNNDNEAPLSDLDIVAGIVKTEHVEMSVSAPDPEPEICLPVVDAEIAVCPPQPDLVAESCLPVEEIPEDAPPSEEVPASCLPMANGDLALITSDMIEPEPGLPPDKDDLETGPQEALPPEPCLPPENFEVVAAASPDIVEDNSEVFLPAVDDSWLDSDKSNDAIHTRGESRVKFSDSFEISNTTAKMQEPVTAAVTDANHVGVITPEEEYRLRRTTSMESRDNPFIPDGELSKEADDLLKRATIIRDQFILNEDKQRPDSQNLPNDSNVMSVAVDHPPPVVQETVVVSASAKPAQATPVKKAKKNKKEKKLKENGKVEDSVSPDASKPEVTGSAGSEKPSAAGDKTDSAADTVDNKKQKKCCAIM